MEFASQTNVGKRLQNEDSLYTPQPDDALCLIAVADGMGGHRAGRRASLLAVEGISSQLHMLPEGTQTDPLIRLRNAIHSVNQQIFKLSHTDPGCRGMGTTLTLALLFGEHYIAANIGDSRLYHFDGWSLTQVTQDHSLVAVLVENGEITRAEAGVHPQRNIITRALGTSFYEEADFFQRLWKPDDILMLSSDGLHGSIPEGEFDDYMRMDLPLQDICDMLVERALREGATDNVTVVLARNSKEVSCA